jgi:hypothetical protein
MVPADSHDDVAVDVDHGGAHDFTGVDVDVTGCLERECRHAQTTGSLMSLM